MADSAAFIAVAQAGSENGFSSVFNTPIIVFIGAIVFYVVTLAKAFRSRTRRAKVGWSIGAVFLALICLLSIVACLYRGSSALDERVASAINALAKRFNSEPARETVQRTSPADTSKTTTPDQNAALPLPAGEDQALNLPTLAHKARGAVVLIEVYEASGEPIGTGSGFFISEDGRLVTNWHVVEGAASAVAKLENGAIYIINGVLASSSTLDLAVLKADARDVQFLPMDGTTTPPEPGTRVAVIGSPLALEGSLSEGIVSANRAGEDGSWLQISAPISPGSSGSPVFDRYGRVIGVATLIAMDGQNLNFARSSHDLAELIGSVSPNAKPAPFAPRRISSVKVLPGKELNIRTDARADSPVVAKVYPGDHVYLENGRVINNTGKARVIWQRVTSMSGLTGWANADYLSSDPNGDVLATPTQTPAASGSPATTPIPADTEVRQLFEQWFRASNHGNAEQEASLYAESTDYLDFGTLTRRQLLQELQKDRQRWPQQQYSTFGKAPFIEKVSDSEWHVNFEIKFDVRDPSSRKQVTGTASLTWIVRKRASGGVEIVSSKEQVTSRTRRDLKHSTR